MTEYHTPGPWSVVRARTPTDGEYDWAIGAKIDGRTHCIAEAFGRTAEHHRPNAHANARLMAGAPELLEALVKLSNEVLGSLPLMEPLARREMGNSNYNILIQRAEEARAAVVKITGAA